MNHLTKGAQFFRSKTPTGFTILELMVVVTIMATLFAIATPATVEQLRERGVHNAADQLAMDLQRAKLLAIERNADCSMTINSPDANQYTISIANEVIDLAGYMGTVVFTNSPDPSDTAVTFNSEGICQATRVFFLTNQKRRFRVRVTVAGGISVHEFVGGNWV